MITSAAKVADTDMLTRVAHCLHRHHWQFGCLLGQFVTNISTFKHFQINMGSISFGMSMSFCSGDFIIRDH